MVYGLKGSVKTPKIACMLEIEHEGKISILLIDTYTSSVISRLAALRPPHVLLHRWRGLLPPGNQINAQRHYSRWRVSRSWPLFEKLMRLSFPFRRYACYTCCYKEENKWACGRERRWVIYTQKIPRDPFSSETACPTPPKGAPSVNSNVAKKDKAVANDGDSSTGGLGLCACLLVFLSGRSVGFALGVLFSWWWSSLRPAAPPSTLIYNSDCKWSFTSHEVSTQ